MTLDTARTSADSVDDHLSDHNTLHARHNDIISVTDSAYGATGDGSTDDTAAINSAITAINEHSNRSSGIVYIPQPAVNYRCDDSIVLKARVLIRGPGFYAETSPSASAVIRFTDSTKPGFKTAPDGDLSHAGVEKLSVVGASNTAAGHHAFDLRGVYNNTFFRDVMAMFFGGDVFQIGTSPLDGDVVALGAALFEKVFAINCGGYFINSDGNTVATLLGVNTNNVNGLLNLTGGTGDNQVVNAIGCWYEGADTTPVVTCDAWPTGSLLNLVGLSAPTSTPDSLVHIKTSGAPVVTLVGCQSFGGIDPWIDDDVGGLTISRARGFYVYNGTTRLGNTTIASNAPAFDIEDLDGTTDQKRLRVQVAGSFSNFTSRTDAGGQVAELLRLIHSTGEVQVKNQLSAEGSLAHKGSAVGFYNTTPVSQQTGVAVTAEAIHAALVSLGLITA